MTVGLFSSCVSYRVLDVEVLEPAVVHLERGSRLAFFDRNAEGRENIIRFAEPSVRRELTVEFGRGMDYQLLQAGLDTVLLLGNYQEEKVDSLSAQPPLVRDSVWAICSRFGLDGLVSLEAVFYDYRQGDIHCRWLLRLYDGYEGIPVDLIVLEDSFPEEEFGGDLCIGRIAVCFVLGRRGKVRATACAFVAGNPAADIPAWQGIGLRGCFFEERASERSRSFVGAGCFVAGQNGCTGMY